MLTGNIPEELADLGNLRRLELHNNRLTGEIPEELGNLTGLLSLYLWGNQLTGEIPKELGNLSRLETLYLFSNQLSGEIPSELGRLRRLRRLSLAENQFTGEIPPQLGKLSLLQWLYLSENRLTGDIPQELTKLARLKVAAFYSNPGLCAPIDDVFQTWIDGIPSFRGSSCAPTDSLEDRAVLVELYNSTNGDNWTNKTNWLSDRPMRDWHDVTTDAGGRVTGLYLSNHKLNGKLPVSLGSLDNLRELHLTNNRLSGEIPAELGNLTSLTSLDLSRNQLSGGIPVEIGNLPSLESLYLSHNRLTGVIPVELASLANLRLLRLSGNPLTGCIPNELRYVDSHDLYELDLQYCDCTTGVAVPNPSNQPGLVSDCEALLASRDTLAGAATLNWSADIPIADWDGVTVSGTPGRVMELALQEKGLKGRLSSELGSLTDLVGLNLFGNDLRGPIPLELGNLAKLQWLYLAGNQLTGCVPDGLRDVPENDLETISKWQVAIGDGTTGVRTQAAAIRCSSTPFCRSVPEQHGTWRAMLESVPQPTGAQDTVCAQNRPTSPRRCVGCVADSRVWRRLDDPKDCHTPCPSTGAVGHPR